MGHELTVTTVLKTRDGGVESAHVSFGCGGCRLRGGIEVTPAAQAVRLVDALRAAHWASVAMAEGATG